MGVGKNDKICAVAALPESRRSVKVIYGMQRSNFTNTGVQVLRVPRFWSFFLPGSYLLPPGKLVSETPSLGL